jgi:hypothetical protein
MPRQDETYHPELKHRGVAAFDELMGRNIAHTDIQPVGPRNPAFGNVAEYERDPATDVYHPVLRRRTGQEYREQQRFSRRK